MGRRTLLLITSIIVAALGTALIAVYVQGADDRARRKEALVPVLTTTGPISPGTSASNAQQQGAFRLLQVPQRLKVDRAVVDLNQITGQSATTLILANQQITTAMFAKNGAVNGASVSKDMLGVTLSLGDPNHVGSFLSIGDWVTIFYSYDDPKGGKRTKVLLSKVQVLGIGSTSRGSQQAAAAAGQSAAPAGSSSLITLDLQPRDAALVINATSQGELYFALRGDTVSVPDNLQATTSDVTG